jgi:predicted permease
MPMRATDVYRALLWCYPAPFRREYAREMVGAFDAELRDARDRAGRGAQLAIWARALRDLPLTALREHRHVMIQDLRHAIRVLLATPGFSLVAILSLAIGIGANVAIFSLVNSVLLRALPVPRPHELVIFTEPTAQGVAVGSSSGTRGLATYDEFLELQAGQRTVAPMFASTSSLQRVHARLGGGEPEEIAVRLVSSAYFETLGVTPAIGRVFGGAEPAPGTAPDAVLGYDFWQRRFGGDAGVIGRPVAFPDGVLQVIGIAPRGFTGETIGEQPDVWVPLAMQPTVLPGRRWLHDVPGSVEKVMWLHVFGRLKPDVTIAAAQADANVAFQQGLSRYYGAIADEKQRKEFLNQRLELRPAASGASSLRDFADPLLVLLGASALVLLIACANLGNLLLARATARQREVTVRLALGAGRGRLVRQLLTESLCLALAGGVAGLGAALVLRQGLLRLLPDAVSLPVAVDWRVLAFAFALTAAAGLALGLLPALRVTKTPVAAGLRDQARGVAGSAAWLRVGRAVVVGQLALSLPLLVGAGLLARTLINLQRVELGYDRDRLMVLRVDTEAAGYEPLPQGEALGALLARVRAVPGVAAASLSNNGLFLGSDNGDEITVEGYTRKGQGDRGSRYDAVAPGYFATLGIPVLVGREFTEQDRAGGHKVCVINDAFAKRFFAGRNPIGLHVTQQYAEQRNTYEVVGVVRDSRQNRLRGAIEHRFYTPLTQPAASIGSVGFIVRPKGDAAAVLGEVRRVIQRAEPRMAIVRAGLVDEAIERRLGQDRMMAQLSVAFAVVAGLLAALGLYGVLSYGVSRRTPEIGLRKALGARHGTLVAMILRETGWLLVAGLAIGGALSAGAAQLIASRLYGLTPADPVTFLVATLALAAVAMLASWLPAFRASRVDPLVALRHE